MYTELAKAYIHRKILLTPKGMRYHIKHSEPDPRRYSVYEFYDYMRSDGGVSFR